MERTTRAGAIVAGGHTIEDEEPKFGLVVYGEVPLTEIWYTKGAKPGDKIILTKPLGTGALVAAFKAAMLSEEEEATMTSAMVQLNDLPLRLPREIRLQVHACTDVTGFGLMGHLLDMLDENIDIKLNVKISPLKRSVREGFHGPGPAGTYRNKACYTEAGKIKGLELLHEDLQDILFGRKHRADCFWPLTHQPQEEHLTG